MGAAAHLFVKGSNPRYWAAKRTAWSWWQRFLLQYQWPPLSTSSPQGEVDAQLACFVGFLTVNGLAGSTVEAYLWDVVKVLRVFWRIDLKVGFVVKATLSGAKAVTPPPSVRAVLSAAHLAAVVAPLRRVDPDELALRTALLFMFAGGWRVSAVTAAPTLRHTLRLGDVCVWPSLQAPQVVAVWERSSKVAQPGHLPAREVWLGATPSTPDLCPVAHFMEWLPVARSRRGVCSATPLFVLQSGLSLTASGVNRFLRRRAQELGWPAKCLTSHVLRVSAASNLRVAGASARATYKHCGWSVPGENAVAERVYNREGRQLVQGLASAMMGTSFAQFARGEPVVAMEQGASRC